MAHDTNFDKQRHVLVPLLPCKHAYRKDPSKSLVTKKRHLCMICQQEKKQSPAATLTPATSPAAASPSEQLSVVVLSLTDPRIRVDADLQPREALSAEVIEAYQREYEEGADLGPLLLVGEGDTLWLADGWHRWEGATAAGKDALPFLIRPGTRRDAILAAAFANNTHGLRMTNADKRKVVLRLLQDEEWGEWPLREIARKCLVSHEFVRQLSQKLSTVDSNGKETIPPPGKAAMEASSDGDISANNRNDTPLDTLPDVECDAHEPVMLGNGASRCGRCGKTLTNEESIKRGIGPVCAGGGGNGTGGGPAVGGGSVLSAMRSVGESFGVWAGLMQALQVLSKLERPYDTGMTMSQSEAKAIESVLLQAQVNLTEFCRGWQQQRQQCKTALVSTE